MPFNPERELLCSLIACGGKRKGIKWANGKQAKLFKLIDEGYVQVYGKSYEDGDVIITKSGRAYFNSLIAHRHYELTTERKAKKEWEFIMSGGRFEYAYSEVDDTRVFEKLSIMYDMENYLRQIGKHSAADEILLYIKEVETHQRRLFAIGRRIAPLMKAVEWHGSGDWGIESIDRAYNELMGITEKDTPNAAT